MFASFSIPFGLPRFGFGGNKSQAIDIPSVEIQDVETGVDKRARTLKHLLKANHANHSIIYHNLEFHNHAPHVSSLKEWGRISSTKHDVEILGSAYLLGATPEQLNTIYDVESRFLEPWHDSPGEIIKEDWRESLGKRKCVFSANLLLNLSRRLILGSYQRAYIDFFEDQLVQKGYDWKRLVEDFLYEGNEPLINNVVAGRKTSYLTSICSEC